MKSVKIALILPLSIITTFLLGCTAGESRETFWIVDPNDFFHTNDVKRAQNEIPFTIILPTYLPSIMGSNYAYQIDGPLKKKTTLKLKLIYHTFKGKIVFILANKMLGLLWSQMKH